ncbi:MAG TPA: twin-arginine translocation signal domain-containing protein [Vicinamibacterales bacterium]|jgi:predicted RNA-binding Zn-ribbon protein involved in translation (DUF1610 family)
MNEEILKKLDQKVGRRSFLKGSGLAAATLVGVFAASPLVGLAQQQPPPPPPPDDKKKDDPKKDDPDQKKNDQKSDDGADKETKIDAEGHEYRVCPQCGSNMYRQGRTWTCENCGYSYIE